MARNTPAGSQEQGKPRAPGPRAVRPSPKRYEIRIRYEVPGGIESLGFTTDDQSFYPHVQSWRYVVANRSRITSQTSDTLSQEILDWLLRMLGPGDGALAGRVGDMTKSGLIEVGMPWHGDEGVGWAARVFPWEIVLGLLTSPIGRDGVTILRHLEDGSRKPVARAAVPTSALVVRSGPGELGRMFSFDSECGMVVEALDLAPAAGCPSILRDPDREGLGGCVQSGSPSVIHLSGVDPLALDTYHLAQIDRDRPDGFVLRTAPPQVYDSVKPVDLAQLLTRGTKNSLVLVSVASCFSAPRVAAMAAAHGAMHAIGFEDTISDNDAMIFFSAFYRRWAQDWNLLEAFRQARLEWSRSAATKGGVVLWSRRSLLTAAAPMAGVSRAPVPTEAVEAKDLRLSVRIAPEWTPGSRQRREPSLNYSLLHNNRPPLAQFLVDKPKSGKLPPLRVEVALEVGQEICRCRFTRDLPEEAVATNLLDDIRLPLVAGLLRQCSEALRSILYIRVECDGHILRESSEPVSVLPADEWRDDGEDHLWLPSFVLPRDPGVLRVIRTAQSYLRTLLDECAAGFDGYQQLDPDDGNAAEVVDPQVRAIWAALQHDLPLNYINPPPSYSSQSQRLRSPSQIFDGQAATCIDMALLFASCLEFVGIYPVVFLIAGHAFPGYWRSDKAWWRMMEFRYKGVDGEQAGEPEHSGVTRGQSETWMFNGTDNLRELLRYVQDGSLVPFESTYVTAQRGFYASLEAGASNLHPDTFDAMIDIQAARGANVTPLPLIERTPERPS